MEEVLLRAQGRRNDRPRERRGSNRGQRPGMGRTLSQVQKWFKAELFATRTLVVPLFLVILRT